MIRASIVIATYNRNERLARLLSTLSHQTIPREDFEIVVVDDGSREDPTPVAQRFASRLQLSILRQANSGVAIARQRGVERARGRIVIFLDDDMLAFDDFVEKHLDEHGAYDDRVVMGELLPDENIEELPLFERYFAYQLTLAAERFAAARTFGGHEVYTGNLSLPRELFLRVGGFDPAFYIEDVELGVRLEKAGAKFVFSRAAATVHASDHTSLEKWLLRSEREGRDWLKLGRKHPGSPTASPWRFLAIANPLSRPFFALAMLAPKTTPAITKLVARGAETSDALGLRRASLSAMTLLYGVQYFRGVRVEAGSLRDTLAEYRAYARAARA